MASFGVVLVGLFPSFFLDFWSIEGFSTLTSTSLRMIIMIVGLSEVELQGKSVYIFRTDAGLLLEGEISLGLFDLIL
jgi:hypothetical protein